MGIILARLLFPTQPTTGQRRFSEPDFPTVHHELKQKGVTVIAIQASKANENGLSEWVKANNIPFPVGIVQGDEEKARFSWGVGALPWLILTDKQNIVQAEGFSINELDERIATLREK